MPNTYATVPVQDKSLRDAVDTSLSVKLEFTKEGIYLYLPSVTLSRFEGDDLEFMPSTSKIIVQEYMGPRSCTAKSNMKAEQCSIVSTKVRLPAELERSIRLKYGGCTEILFKIEQIFDNPNRIVIDIMTPHTA